MLPASALETDCCDRGGGGGDGKVQTRPVWEREKSLSVGGRVRSSYWDFKSSKDMLVLSHLAVKVQNHLDKNTVYIISQEYFRKEE